jgi:hypothetical protein
MFKKINEIIAANMDTVTNNSFLFIINSKTVHAEGLFFNTKSVSDNLTL